MPAPIGSVEAFTIEGYEAVPSVGEVAVKIIGGAALVITAGLVLLAVLRGPKRERAY